MKWLTHPVKIRKKVDGKVVGSEEVGVANFQEFDSVGEAIQELGDAKTLELINAQNRTNALNDLRSKNRPGSLSKTALRNIAISKMEASDWQQVAAAAADGTSQSVLENILAAKIASIQAERQASGVDEGDDD